MNICIVTQRYPYNDNMEFVFVKKIVDEWAKMGHRCVVITDFSWTTYLRKRIDYKPLHYIDVVSEGISVDVYNPRTISLKLNIGDVSANNFLSRLAFERQIKKLHIDFDFIYCHFFSSALVAFRYAERRNIPFFVATGESTIEKLWKPYSGFKWEIFRSYTKGIIAVSSKNKDEATIRNLIDPQKCEVFPNGVDLTAFHPIERTECREKLGFPKENFIISCVGFFCERKGQDRLLDAVRRIGGPNIKIIFLGKSAKINPIELEGDEILFKGAVENKDLPTYLCSSDIFCLPTRAEGCCNAIIEALACGIPVVSSNLPFNLDVLDESNSILIDPNNVDEISKAIERMATNKELCELLSDGALNRAKSLSIGNRASLILNYISKRL